MQSSLKTPGSIWAKLIEQNAANSKKPEGRGDAYVYFVGSRGSGKSTLLNRFLYPSKVEVPKPSEGLEYTYARKAREGHHEKKDLAHIWEMGGSPEFTQLVTGSDQLFLTAKQVTTAVVVIVVDLSDPPSIVSSVSSWIQHINAKLTETYEKFAKKGLQLPEQLKQRAKNKLYNGHEDKDVVSHTGISLVIAATKYDKLQNQDPEIKKIIARTLRYIAHMNGAFLVYLANLHSMSDRSKEFELEKALLDNFSRLLNQLVFTGLEKKPTLKMTLHIDDNGTLMIPAGSDSFRNIGRPQGAVDNDIARGLKDWRDMCDKYFPPKATVKASEFKIDEQFQDDEIEQLYQRKKQQLKDLQDQSVVMKDVSNKKAVASSTTSKQQTAATKSQGALKSSESPAIKVKKKVPASDTTSTPSSDKIKAIA